MKDPTFENASGKHFSRKRTQFVSASAIPEIKESRFCQIPDLYIIY